jgi:hypothetical protein
VGHAWLESAATIALAALRLTIARPAALTCRHDPLAIACGVR